ncbi:Mitochondrial inner membrane protease [Lasiodiplodia theobromae]|uniref:Mitochondrial inner membrane protease n=1 Tax=Lasiodiplodia theobromae TaxID=45133 RepID=UPI0015C3997B|nr:Mitochondrial inner membrane protease [Lasiodiplodia theobromae]KAF4546218.1 Mitochondrial inner membrane protease [Lasiodiplodia theobromae]
MPLPRLPRIRFGSLPLTAGQVVFHTLACGAMLHAFFSFGWTVKPTWGASMVPTIQVLGDCVLISKHYRRGKNIVVGDVVNYENPFKLGSGVIKRVIGMPGDFVLRDTPHAEGSEGMMIQVPEGHCWVTGDNLPVSRDSRLHGPVPLALIRGKVVARVLPFSQAGWFENTLTEPMEIGDMDELD